MYTLSIGYPGEGEGEGTGDENPWDGEGLFPHEVYDRVLDFSQTTDTTLLDGVEVKREDGAGCLHITYCEQGMALVIINTLAPVNESPGGDMEIWDAFFMTIRVSGRHLLPREQAHEVMRHYLFHQACHDGYSWEECRLDRLH